MRRSPWLPAYGFAIIATMFGRPGHKRAPMFALAATIVLLARAIVPAGYMLAPAAAGATVVLCTDHGPVHAPAGPEKHGPPSQHDSLCPFAASADVGRDTSLPAPPSLAAMALRADAPAARISPTPGIAAPPPPATGPPALV